MIRVEVVMDAQVISLMKATNLQLTRIGDLMAGLKDELTALVTAFDTATNGVAAEIAKLRDQITALLNNPDAISNADKAAVEASFQAQIDRLTSLGQDPTQPVPPAPTPTA